MVETKGLEVIGYFLWWTIHNVKISRDTFRNLLKTFGINYDMGDDQEREIALHRAAFLKAVREVKAKSKEFLIRKIKKDADCYVFGLVDESVDKGNENLIYHHSATMTFLPETGALTCDFSHRAFEEIKPRYEEYREFLNSDDIRSILLDLILQFHRVGVRRRGGIYFVHKDFSKEIEQIEKLVESLPGGESYLAVVPQIDAEKSRKVVHKAFISDLRTKMEEFNEQVESDAFSRKNAWEHKISEFKQLREQVEFYSDRMAFQAEDIRNQLTALQEKVRAKLVE